MKARRGQSSASSLRRRAEAALRSRSPGLVPRSTTEARSIVHELKVHQIELEMQNEELRQAQQDLAESRDRLADLYDFAPVGYVTLDAHGAILEANLTAAKILGIARKDLLRKKFFGFVARESQDAFYLHNQQVFAQEKSHDCELMLRRRDGKPFAARFESAPFTDVMGVRRCYATFTDITALRQVEEALRERKEEYRLLFDMNPCPMWICDEDKLDFLDVNEAALKLYGWSRKEFLKLTIRDIQPPEDLSRFLGVFAAQRRSRTTAAGEWRQCKCDGTVFEVAVTVSSISYASRAARLVLVSDITERKRAERKLEELNTHLEQRVAERTAELTAANERLQTIMDAALIGVLTLDDRGVIQSSNPAALRIFGYELVETIGRNVGRLMASPHQAQHEGFLDHYLRGGKSLLQGIRGEALGRRKDGRMVILELSLAEVAVGARRQYVAMVRDVTGRKRLERELIDISERERQRIGRDLHDGLGQQLHGLSYLAALVEKSLHEDASPRAAEVGRLNKHLAEALDLTRALAHGLQPVKALPEGLMIALRELAKRTRGLYRIECAFECRSPVLIHRHNAANHLYRIAQEAVNNAMKHGKPNRIRIKLAAMPQRIILGVRDNGLGFRTRKASSRGMGLHVMQYRADAIRGSLVVQRHPRGGTEVVCSVKRDALLRREDYAP